MPPRFARTAIGVIGLALLSVAACGGTVDGGAPSAPSTPVVATVDSVIVAAVQPVTVGKTAQLSVVVKSRTGATLSGRPVTWASADTSIAEVAAAGLLTAKFPGGVTIRATSEGVTGST